VKAKGWYAQPWVRLFMIAGLRQLVRSWQYQYGEPTDATTLYWGRWWKREKR